LLGNLNDEYSCANSRFFRTVLYANAEVSKELREKFILHWQSVRPVPVITIDFGDGRKIRRTVTGNSIHYVLTAEGKVVDGIPGLYGPKAFLRELEAGSKIVATLNQLKPESDLPAALAQWHATQAGEIDAAYEMDLQKIHKLDVKQAPSPAVVAAMAEDETWKQIAAIHATDCRLDQGSQALMAAKSPDAATAARRAMSKSFVETPLIRTMRNFQRSIAEDTVRNEYLFHLQIHRWLADPANANVVDDVMALNKKVYAELFLTPDSDPWLGLVPADTYSALDDDGACH
jgi:hypothetical protein